VAIEKMMEGSIWAQKYGKISHFAKMRVICMVMVHPLAVDGVVI